MTLLSDDKNVMSVRPLPASRMLRCVLDIQLSKWPREGWFTLSNQHLWKLRLSHLLEVMQNLRQVHAETGEHLGSQLS